MDGYDLVICEECGMAYADGIPSQAEFDRYYAEMSKYERVSLTNVEKWRFVDIADNLVPYLKDGATLLDIGCGNGGLLCELKTRGFKNLFGVSLSSRCTNNMWSKHSIHGMEANISDLQKFASRFDIITLIGVLEHLPNPMWAIKVVSKLLKKGAAIYIEVPDAGRFASHTTAPYQFISMEHINYFSGESLRNLMARAGLHAAATSLVERNLSENAKEPIIAGLFYSHAPDTWAESGLTKYLEASRQAEQRINAE